MLRNNIKKLLNVHNNNNYLPEFFRLRNHDDKQRFEKLLGDIPCLVVYDEIVGQVEELIKCQNPKRVFSKEELHAAALQLVNDEGNEEYGVWVYYPWSNRLVHILDKDEFIEIRTSRNRYKITNQEQEILATKRVGVIGLSVGQSVALTIAMERSCGELRIADFDVLELTNYNRIRTGIHNLGLLKTISVAREIAEIDPFLKVICFSEGLREDNVDRFLLEGGKLDVLIDECDGVDIKILSRLKAKALNIPVLMEASDKGTIDVERFDLEPNRSILHGLIDHLDVSKFKDLKTNEEKIPYLAPMVGIDTMSSRLKASAVEVGQTITTWPQLASAVFLGGAAVGDIWRRIGLDQFKSSNRYFIDIEQLVGDSVNNDCVSNEIKLSNNISPLTYAAIENVVSKYYSPIPNEIRLDKEIIKKIIENAICAPSGGNSQPWKWIYKGNNLFLFFDKHYSVSFMDFQDKSSFIALGAAIENVVLTAHSFQLKVDVQYFSEVSTDGLIAILKFEDRSQVEKSKESHEFDSLVDFIPLRSTNRKITSREILDINILSELQKAGESFNGARLKFFDNIDELAEIGDIVGSTDRLRLLCSQSHHDFINNEMRWSSEEAEKKGTGMDVHSLELSPSELVGLKLIRDPKVIDLIKDFKGGNVFRNVSKKSVLSSSAIGFLTMPHYSNHDYVIGGRAMQRIWLKATQLNIALQPLCVPFAFFSRLKHDISQLPNDIKDEVEKLQERFNTIMQHTDYHGEIFLFRIFIAENSNVKSFRRPISEVFFFDE